MEVIHGGFAAKDFTLDPHGCVDGKARKNR
jgi:hypothetical protein